MSKLVPRLKELVMSERDKKTNDPLMWCRGDDGETYMLQFDDGMIVNLAIALLDEAAKAGIPGIANSAIRGMIKDFFEVIQEFCEAWDELIKGTDTTDPVDPCDAVG